MSPNDINVPPAGWGSYSDAEALRRWSFAQRTPEQRLDWLVSALELAYASGAITPRQTLAVHSLQPFTSRGGVVTSEQVRQLGDSND